MDAVIRFLFRVLATLTLAAAVVLGVVDATRSVAASRLVTTPLRESWEAAFPGSLDSAQAFVQENVAGFLWDPVAVAILGQPGFAVLAVLAFLLYAAGRRSARPRDEWA